MLWWCHESWLIRGVLSPVRGCSDDVMSPGSGHRPHSEASHRNMVIILTTLSPIIVITGETGDQSEARFRDSWPIRCQLTEVAGWYQAESDLANNSRTQTSLAKTAIMELRLVQSRVEVSSSLGSALNCWAWSCLNEMREWPDLDQHQRVHETILYEWPGLGPVGGWEAGIWSNILTNYVWPCKKQSNDPSQAWLDRYNRHCSAESPVSLGLVPATELRSKH